jgi:hypothetical protein
MSQSPKPSGSGGKPEKQAVTKSAPADSELVAVELVPLDDQTHAAQKKKTAGAPADQVVVADLDEVVVADLDEIVVADLDEKVAAGCDDHLVEVLPDEELPAGKLPPPGNVNRVKNLEPSSPTQHRQPSDNATPDWLGDVSAMEASRKSAPRAVPGTPLDWLADIEQVEGRRPPN